MTTKKKAESKKLSMADFNFKGIHERGGVMKMITPAGHDSGAHLIVRGPDCDESIGAVRILTRALFAIEDSLVELKAKAEESQNWYEYNTSKHDLTVVANTNFCCAVVTGWNLEEAFSEEALRELIYNWPALIDQVAAFHAEARVNLEAK